MVIWSFHLQLFLFSILAIKLSKEYTVLACDVSAASSLLCNHGYLHFSKSDCKKKKKKISAENIFVIVVSQISEAGAARS
jgi:hypothetical protein